MYFSQTVTHGLLNLLTLRINAVPNLRLKKLCVTRWASRVDALEVIEEKESNAIITADCRRRITALMKFEFCWVYLLGIFTATSKVPLRLFAV